MPIRNKRGEPITEERIRQLAASPEFAAILSQWNEEEQEAMINIVMLITDSFDSLLQAEFAIDCYVKKEKRPQEAVESPESARND